MERVIIWLDTLMISRFRRHSSALVVTLGKDGESILRRICKWADE